MYFHRKKIHEMMKLHKDEIININSAQKYKMKF